MGFRTINYMTPQCGPAFCRCYNPPKGGGPEANVNTNNLPQPNCRCGEFDAPRLDWSWDPQMSHPEARFDGESVVFHPLSSRGTAVVRGNRPLELNHIHFWEVKITSFMSGTDLMIGIGTDAVAINSHQHRFASFLGLDDQSWGFSFRGQIQHNKRMKYYGRKFSRGCLVGVYLDRHIGVLKFYVNRRPQGVAYYNIPANATIYPFVCSTSAKSSLKLLSATSIPESLQFHCMRILARDPKMIKSLKSIPGFGALYRDTWFLRCKEKFAYEYPESTTNQQRSQGEPVLAGVEASNAAMDEVARELPDVDDIYADCDTDYFLEPVDATHIQPLDEEEISYLTDGCLISGVHFLL